MSIERVIVLHGYFATPADHWFGWLAETLAAHRVRVEVPALPNSDAPELQQWIDTAVQAIGAPDEHTAIVTHSLGTVTALHALDRIGGDWALGLFAGVAGFVAPLPALPELDNFTETTPDLAQMAARIGRRAVLLSDDDPLVPPAHTRALGDALDAEINVVEGAGHFLAADGVTTLPPVAELLRRA